MDPELAIKLCQCAAHMRRARGRSGSANIESILRDHGLGPELHPLVQRLAAKQSGVGVGHDEQIVLCGRESRFELLSWLGGGASAGVFAAIDLGDGSQVAVKVMDGRDELGDTSFDWEWRALRYLRAVKGALQLRCAFEVSETGVLVTDRCEYTLAEFLDRNGGALPPDLAEPVAWSLTDAVEQLHARSLVHRDLKPDNLLLHASGHWVIGDFGLCVIKGEGREATRPAGTPEYMAPEIAAGFGVRPSAVMAHDPDPAMDVFSLGCVLFHLFEGHPPVRIIEDSSGKRDVGGYVERLQHQLQRAYDRTPVRIQPIIAKCLEASPAKRPRASEVSAMLAEVGASRFRELETQETRTGPPWPERQDSTRQPNLWRSRLILGGTLLTAVLLLFAAGLAAKHLAKTASEDDAGHPDALAEGDGRDGLDPSPAEASVEEQRPTDPIETLAQQVSETLGLHLVRASETASGVTVTGPVMSTMELARARDRLRSFGSQVTIQLGVDPDALRLELERRIEDAGIESVRVDIANRGERHGETYLRIARSIDAEAGATSRALQLGRGLVLDETLIRQ